MGKKKNEESATMNASAVNKEIHDIMNTIAIPYENQEQWGENTPHYPENHPENYVINDAVSVSVTHKLKKDAVANIAAVITKHEMRLLVDEYYSAQDRRKALANQLRAIKQGYDNSSKSHGYITEMLFENADIEEDNIGKILTKVVSDSEVGRWLLSIVGIGPIIAAGLMAYIDIYDTKHNFLRKPSQIISYAGLDDQNRPWLGKEKARKIVNLVVGNSKTITDDHLCEIARLTGWSFNTLNEKCNAKVKSKDEYGRTIRVDKIYKGGVTKRDKEELIKALSKIPYNKKFKVLAWKIGESFQKNCNRGSLYGNIYKLRLAYEKMRNERGDYAEQAAKILETKNIGKDTVAYSWYIQGKLPPAQLIARAKRYAVKIFLHHVYEEMCLVAGFQPYSPYITNRVDDNGFTHRAYIWPEQEFTRPIKDRPGRWMNNSTLEVDTISEFIKSIEDTIDDEDALYFEDDDEIFE